MSAGGQSQMSAGYPSGNQLPGRMQRPPSFYQQAPNITNGADRGAGTIPGTPGGSIVDRFGSGAQMGPQNAMSPLGNFGFNPGQFNPMMLQSLQQAFGRMGGGMQTTQAPGAGASGVGSVGASAGNPGFGPAPNAGSLELAKSMYGGYQNPVNESYGILGGGMGANGTPLTAVDTTNRPQLGTPQTREASEAVMRQFVGQYGREQGLQMYRQFLDNQAIPLSAVGGGGEVAPINLNRRAY